jgi:hypothetical protein
MTTSPMMEISHDHSRDDSDESSDGGSISSSSGGGGGGGSSGKNRKTTKHVKHTMRRLMTIYVDYDEDAILAILTPKERLELMKDGGLDLRDDMADMERRSSVRALELDDDVIVGEEGCVRKKRKRKMSSSGTNLDTPNRPSKQIGLKATKSTTV